MSFNSYIFQKYLRVLLISSLWWLPDPVYVWAQTSPTIIKGKITDASTNQALIGVSVYFPDSEVGTTTDFEGNYYIKTFKNFTKVQFSYIGYKTVTRTIIPGQITVINIKLTSDSKALNEVVITGRKGRYRNKDNPAVDLIRQVIANKPKNRLESSNFVEYERYEKMNLSLVNTSEKLRRNFLLRKFPYLTQTLDTTTIKGKALLPFYLQEVVSQHYYRAHPDKKKTFIKAEKKVDFGEYMSATGVNNYFKHLYQDIDIYQNNILFLTNQFLSPIADMSPTFYKFFITDTLTTNGEKLIELSFEPRNKTDFLFEGQLYVTQDGNYAVRKVEMGVSKTVNINWVRNAKINLDFEKSAGNKYNLEKSELNAEFGLLTNGSAGMVGTRTLFFRNYEVNKPQPDTLYNGVEVVSLPEPTPALEGEQNTLLQESRPEALTFTEQNTYINIERLKNDNSFKRTADWLTAFIAGYKKAGPNIEIGPLNTFYSFNPVEGFRLRFGGRTTNTFSKKVNLEAYGAYGFKDEKVKYYVGATYSFTNRSIFEFPVRSLRVSYQQETKIPGQELQFVQEDNFLLSFKRGTNDKWLYNKTFNVEYLHEYENHFSYRLGVKRWVQNPAGSLVYETVNSEGVKVPIKDLTTGEVMLELRWAPNERFFQGKLYRTPFINKYPVFTLRGVTGVKGFLGGQYNYQNVSFNILKRLHLSQLGYTDAVTEVGYTFGQAPFPFLTIHRANQTYSYQLQSYNLMNFLEFVSDQYASLTLDHTFNGFIFNKIPLIKKTNLREYATLKVLYGGLRDENQPQNNPSLMRLPVDEQGAPLTYTLEKKPYIEGSVGIGNIFKFFRVDLVKRFSYLDHPNVSELGIRGRFKFDF
ncbi:MAG: DUF5686 and carboxypeptidase regulatory-like domain-containing protein [Bacteroidota bacterium]|nr:DUF5686 and carboxypeptidase regulatory-like domain-containing protein [Bacteroidota bacterium]